MPGFRSQAASRLIIRRLLPVWRVGVLCATITHEREHPALAILILVPLNHLLFNLTASLDPSARGPATSSHTRPFGVRAARVLLVYVLATSALVWWYGSYRAVAADLRAFSATWEWW